MSTSESPIDTLTQAIERVGTCACVGIDPVLEKIPRSLRLNSELEAIEIFSLKLLDSIIGIVPVVKPQSACFERYGSAGYAILEKVIAHARELGFVVILDAKRADIESSAEHYAVGAARMGAQFITVSPYMGPSSVKPFLRAGLGVFALARTSNPDSDEIQQLQLSDGNTVAQGVSSMIAQMGKEWRGDNGLSRLGAVVGATKGADELSELRSLMPNQMFLVPGVGAQGGRIEDLKPVLRANASTIGQLGVIVNASRSVIYAQSEGDSSWFSTVHEASMRFADELRTFCSAALS